jgi:epoxyqueuosine reductase
MNCANRPIDFTLLAEKIRDWGKSLGFQQIAFADTELSPAERRLENWLMAGHHGNMEYMASHGSKRSRPAELVPGTRSIISVRMDYLPTNDNATAVLADAKLGFISRYALGRDYHKLMRNRLQKLARRIEDEVGTFGYRAFVDSAPVLEKPLAEKAGLGWIGKHSNLVNRQNGSWFFLGELYTDLPLPTDQAESDHCGRCSDCIDICPTQAIIAPYQVDARRCISYLTIELKGAIPVEFRALMGNRIYGCDDCLMACPWNRFAKVSQEADFQPRNGLDSTQLVSLFSWSEEAFLQRLQGSPIRRIGHERWLRNIAVALGNAPTTPEIVDALKSRQDHPSELVREHVKWALTQQGV